MTYTLEKAEIRLADGNILDASFYRNPDSDSCITTCYGLLSYGGSKKQLDLLEECGKFSNFLCFDFKGQGKDKYNSKTTIRGRLEDLSAAIDYASDELGVQNIGLFGTSFGCYISALKAAQDNRVKAMVLIAPFLPRELLTDEELNGNTYEIELNNKTYTFEKAFLKSLREHGSKITKVKCPTLVIGGREDELVDIKDMHQFYNEHLTGEKEFIEIDHGNHAITDIYDRMIAIEASADWFNKHLS